MPEYMEIAVANRLFEFSTETANITSINILDAVVEASNQIDEQDLNVVFEFLGVLLPLLPLPK